VVAMSSCPIHPRTLAWVSCPTCVERTHEGEDHDRQKSEPGTDLPSLFLPASATLARISTGSCSPRPGNSAAGRCAQVHSLRRDVHARLGLAARSCIVCIRGWTRRKIVAAL
jgi:hypothetical protein